MDHRTVMDLAGTDAAAYIRKSRLEEGMDTQEVLSKHQKALVEYAAAHQIQRWSVENPSMPGPRCSGSSRTWRKAAMTPCCAWIWTGSLAAG